MRAGHLSLTALLVAAARAHPDVDGEALSLLPAWVAVLTRLAGGALASPLALGFGAHIRLRTRAIDDVVRRLDAGTTQLVILGAGLDSRALRMPEVARLRVFEVDHPAMQRYKKARLARRYGMARELGFVPVDFERDELGAALEQAGHRADEPTCFVWEGVTMYLGAAARDKTLDAIAARAAPGSVVAATYVTPDLTRLGRLAGSAAHFVFRGIGEPLLGPVAAADLASSFSSRGFQFVSDEGANRWAERFEPRARHLLVLHERLMVTERV